MNWIDIPFHPEKTFLRQFGLLCVGMFGLFATWQALFRGNVFVAIVFGTIAAVFGIVSVVAPSFLRFVFVGWMVLVFPVGWIVSRVLLGVIFYGVITPVSLFFRLVGRDALCRKQESGQQTYWTTRRQTEDVKRYLRQY
ncbi:MAG: SxtJ family membrane protein [Gemmataceae bacterium]